jgi:threonine dehydrogenase-like Zn-dependent dehydrogenase
MLANCWHGKNDVRVDRVPDPEILNDGDAILRVTSTAICGSDLHLYGGFVPTMKEGDILGHEFMGEVVEIGKRVKHVAVGDRVVTAFPIACGSCWFCQQELFSLCENTNPNSWIAEGMLGHSPAGVFGYSHMLGGYPGGQAEYVRVPFADVGTLKVPPGLADEKALFLSDIFPTGYMAADMCNIRGGDTIAVWGCGPVGQFAIRSAYLLGAERVVAIDRFPDRLRMAEEGGAIPLAYDEEGVYETLMQMTGGRGPDAVIDAVGMESHACGLAGAYDRIKQATRLESDRAYALRQAIRCCRNGGTVSVVGVYGGLIDKFPIGSVMNRALTIRTGQAHVQRYMRPLLERVVKGEIDPSFVVTHRMPLTEAPAGYRMFRDKEDACIKIVLQA